MKYLVWGTGLWAEELYAVYYDKLINDNVDIIGFVDNNPKESEFHGIHIYKPEAIVKLDFDYIDIWVIHAYDDIKYQLINELGIPEKRIKRILCKYVEQITKEFEAEMEKKEDKSYTKPSLELLAIYVDWHKRQQWYKYAYREFENRKHCYYAYRWITENIDKSASVLEVASGAGGMLYRLREDGFTNLSGYDVDTESVAVANDLNRITKGCIHFFVEDAKHPNLTEKYDAIVWVNGMYHLTDYSFGQFLECHLSALKPNGFIVFDMVDIRYNEVPQNEYRTDYWGKEGKKEPTEYKIRMSKDEIVSIAEKFGLDLVKYYDIDEVVPKKVYVLKR